MPDDKVWDALTQPLSLPSLLSTASDTKSAPDDAQSRVSQAWHTRVGTDTPKEVSIQFAALQDVAQHRLHANRTVVVVCEEVDRTAHIGSFNMSGL